MHNLLLILNSYEIIRLRFWKKLLNYLCRTWLIHFQNAIKSSSKHLEILYLHIRSLYFAIDI